MSKKQAYGILILFVLVIGLLYLSIKNGSTTFNFDNSNYSVSDFEIEASPRTDGTVDFTYNINCEILKVTSDFDSIYVGIPNKEAKEINVDGENVQNAKIVKDNEKYYIKILFSRTPNIGDELNYVINFRQCNLLSENNNNDELKFEIIALKDVKVNNVSLSWEYDTNVISTSGKIKDDYIIIEKSLRKNQKLSLTVDYEKGTFNTSQNEYELDEFTTKANNSMKSYLNGLNELSNFVFLVLGIIILGAISSCFSGGGYYSGRGFGYGDCMHHSINIEYRSRPIFGDYHSGGFGGPGPRPNSHPGGGFGGGAPRNHSNGMSHRSGGGGIR